MQKLSRTLLPGTRTEGLQKIAVLFALGMTKRYERRRRAKRFHGDETRWEVCEAVDGQTGHRWYRWVRQSASVVLYRMAPGRGAEVPQAPCAKRHQDLVDVVLVGDRYRADTGLAKAGDARMLAFCWAHGRRDVLKAARRGPALDRGMGAWIDDSRERSRLKAARLAGGDETWRLEPQPAIDIQVCFWKSKRPVGVPSRFLRSRAQKALARCPDAWQNTSRPCPPTPSTLRIP
jgi:transposase